MSTHALLLISLLSSAPWQRQVILTGSASDHFRSGMSALAMEKYEKAEAEFQNAVLIDPLFDAAFYGLGQVYMATKRYSEAVRAYINSRDAFKASLAADKFDAEAADRRVRDQLQASKDYGRQLQRMSQTQSPTLVAAIERNKEEQRQLESRLGRAKGAASLPVPAGLSMALGSAYYRVGDIENAEREYLEAVRVDPAFGEAHNNLAVLYMLSGRLQQAEQAIGLAEKAGFNVNPRLKEDLKQRVGK
ncbi:MAG: tetratricopeptide repeat protein [Vicinamibacterales bacterium]